MNDANRAHAGLYPAPAIVVGGLTAGDGPLRGLAADLDAIADLAIDRDRLTRLHAARRVALARLGRSSLTLGDRWIDWAPVGLALALALVTSWTLLSDNAQSLDADLLADALPFDAYLDAGFQRAVGGDAVELLEN
ncbi:MAG: DUF3619 family protein [Burkholderiales bacterium]|jgi:hypothetical protein